MDEPSSNSVSLLGVRFCVEPQVAQVGIAGKENHSCESQADQFQTDEDDCRFEYRHSQFNRRSCGIGSWRSNVTGHDSDACS